jgi:hypothetical protein
MTAFKTTSHRAGSLGESFVIAVVAVFAGFLSVMHIDPGILFPSYDSAAYLYVADEMLKGRVPYSQIWENKGLPLYALDMAGRLLTPHSFMGLWALEIAFSIATFWIVIWVLRRFCSLPATVLATVLLVLGTIITIVGGNIAESWNMPLQATGLAAAWLLVSGEWRSNRWLFAVAGFAAGFAAMMKINLLGTWIALFFLLLALAVVRKVRWSDALGLTALMAAGLAVAVVLSMAPVLAWGATAAWWDQCFAFGLKMTGGGGMAAKLVALEVGLNRIMFISATLVAGLVAAPVAWLAAKRPRPDAKRLWLAGFLLGWLVIELWASTVNGLAYTHYSMPWLIPMTALIGLLFGGKTMRWPGLALAAVVVVASLAYLAPVFSARLDVRAGFPPVVRHETASRIKAQKQMIREVKDRTRPSDKILVWGMDPIVYDVTGRQSVGPYGHPLDILLTPGYQSRAQFSAFMSELQQAPPKLIIDSSAIPRTTPTVERSPQLKGVKPSIMQLRVGAPEDTAVGRVQPYMGALSDFVAAHYQRLSINAPHATYYELVGP